MRETPSNFGFMTAVSLFIAALASGTWSTADARGFCNIDLAPPKDLQEVVTNAAAAFYGGGSNLMTMLATFERGDTDKGKAVGQSATESFDNASRQFKSVASKMPETYDSKLKELKPEIAAAIAQTSQNNPLFAETARAVFERQKPSFELMMLCSNESDHMRVSTTTFLQANPNEERSYAMLLGSWSRALFIGRAVSALFVAAGGQK